MIEQILSSQVAQKLGDMRLSPITHSYSPALKDYTDAQKGNDPYLCSPAYFAMTGRRGLWKIDYKDTISLICRHPNVEDEFLIFPAMGRDPHTLTKLLLHTFARMGTKCRLARVESEGMPLNFMTRIEEDVLDWKYPSHTLDTAKVVKHKGNGFQHFRQKLNGLDIGKIRVRDINNIEDRPMIENILKKWSEGDINKIEPYTRQLDLFGSLPMHGRIVYFDSTPSGFSIWEQTEPEKKLANAYTHLCLHHIKGLSQYIFLDMCRVLSGRGFERLCIGGSETEGLDRFKRNLCPIESVNLSSWVLKDSGVMPDMKRDNVLIDAA